MHSAIPLPGDLVWIRQRRWRVERARRERNVVRLDVASRDRQMTFLAPFDRVAAAGAARSPARVRSRQALARMAHAVATAHGMRSIASAIRARVDILPHQLEPALALLHGARRVLVADEVGLGKTIQAGLVIAETLGRDPAARILVCAPGALRDQWARELHERFAIECLSADRRGLDRLAQECAFGDSPWRRCGVWLGSPDFLKQPHVIDALSRQPWDLVVIDEAHGVCGVSERYDACAEIAARSRRVLLLTATPHSGDEDNFRRLLTLGRLHPDDRLTVFRRTRLAVGLRRDRAVRWRRIALREPETRTIALLISYEAAVLRAAGSQRRDQALLLLSVFRKRALSTMAALVASLERRLAWLGGDAPEAVGWTQPRLGFDADDEAIDDEWGLVADVGLDPKQERSRLRRLIASARTATACETKAGWIAAVLRRTNAPVVVFTEFRDSLHVVSRRIGAARTVALLHGGMTSAERTQQLDRFLHGDATVLLATDVAGQGLNLQVRARWVISLELPWNPARLEQRIGRVDRIGQTRRARFTLLIARGEAEAGVLAHMARRVLNARQALGDDTLSAVSPRDDELRAAILEGGSPGDAPPAAAVPLCTHWSRAACALATGLTRMRALATRWQGPAPMRGAWAIARWRRGQPLGAPGLLAVFAVPLVSAGGEVIERRVVAIRAPGRWQSPSLRDAAIEAARKRADELLRARAARLTRLRTALAARDAAADGALASRLFETGPREIQRGLFDRRADRALEAVDEEHRTIDEFLRASRDRRAAGTAIAVARPVLIAALFSR